MIDFIVNPKSGKGKGRKAIKIISKYCKKCSVEFAIHITAGKGHATKIAKSLCLSGADTVVAVGGDGTFHEVLNGIDDFEKTRIGFVPAGRGNDYARAAKLNLNLKKAVQDIVHGEEIRSDYIQVGSVRCLNVAGTGLDTEVLKRVMGKSGKITYLKSLLYCIKHFEPYKIRITQNGQTHEEDVIMIGVCNGIAIGGGMKLSPNSDPSDGKMETVSIRVPKNGKIMKALVAFLKGKHIGEEYTTVFPADEVNIEPAVPQTVQIDGELYDGLDFSCRIVKSGLKTFRGSAR